MTIFTLSFTPAVLFADDEAPSRGGPGSAVIREMNAARQNPRAYAAHLEQLRLTFDGAAVVLPGGTRLRTKEGVRAIDEAIRFLQNTSPLPALITSTGMSRAAADHCADQAGGGFGHSGSDRSNPAARINRYGVCTGGWAENISYGKSSARDVVIALIVDDGQPARKHRKNIFNPVYSVAGAAFGRHAKFGAMCSIDFAGGYAESGRASGDDQLLARNF